MKSKGCGERRPHGPHKWQRQRTSFFCGGSVEDVMSKGVRLSKLLREAQENTSCSRGLDLLHEEFYQLGGYDFAVTSSGYLTTGLHWGSKFTSIEYKPMEFVLKSGHYYVSFDTGTWEQKTEAPNTFATRKEELESLLYDCLWHYPRCRWQHDDSNDDV